MENQNIEDLTKLAEQGDTAAIRKLADNFFLDKEDYQKALELYLKLADQNDAEVWRRIGYCYNLSGNKEKAFEWFLKSAELGNARAQRCVGIYYEKGYFVAQSYEKAVEWYTKAAEQGDTVAQLNLGVCYNYGYGVKQSYEKANEWYTKAAEQGDENAIKYLEELKEELAEEEKNNSESPGWDAITAEFERLYPGQTNPKHYGTIVPWILGGNDPLPGISVYDAGDYWHFVTYGLTDLNEKESEDEEWSGYGYEMTLKLKKYDFDNEEREIRCICGILQALARQTFKNGDIYGFNEYIYTGQTTGIDVGQKSNITGFISVADSSAQTIDTPNGKVNFVQFIGVTDAELKSIMKKDNSVEDIYKKLGSDLTDYHRESIV